MLYSGRRFNSHAFLNALVALVFAGLLISGLSACSRKAPDTSEIIRPVRVMELQSAAAAVQESYPAQIEPRYSSPLSFLVGGKLLERKVELGQRVTKNQVIARIDPQDLQLGLKAAQAQLDAAKADQSQAKTDLDRSKTLKDQGFVSQAELDRRQLALDAAASRLNQATAQFNVQSNQARYGTLLAPNDGVIAQVFVEAGQNVSPGQPVVQWADPKAVQARIAVPEGRVAAYKVGRAAQARLWAGQDALDATVREVSPVADPLTRAYPVLLDIKDPKAEARFGMSATVLFSREVSQSAFKLPIASLVASTQGAYVWVFDEKQGIVNKREVKPFDISESDFLVKEGLKEGELIVTAGTHVLNDGQKAKRFIEPKDIEKAARATK
ncbi:MAG: efflux RND transporter periplasmic adaptor subunit [Limnobacter sp.]|nr:efflux RND transporter periplasmic adaptor subunit [Limnobacter sp.]